MPLLTLIVRSGAGPTVGLISQPTRVRFPLSQLWCSTNCFKDFLRIVALYTIVSDCMAVETVWHQQRLIVKLPPLLLWSGDRPSFVI